MQCLSCRGPRPGNYPDGHTDVSRMNSRSSLGPDQPAARHLGESTTNSGRCGEEEWPPGEPQVLSKTPRGQRATPPRGEVDSEAPLRGNLSSPGPSSLPVIPVFPSPSTRRLLGQGGVSSARAAGVHTASHGPCSWAALGSVLGPDSHPGAVSGSLAGPPQDLVLSVVLGWPTKLCLACE